MRTSRNIPGMMLNLPKMVSEMMNEENVNGFNNFIQEFNKPQVNIKEDDNGYYLDLVVPGFNKEDFKVEVKDGHLEISADLKKENSEEKENYTHREFISKSFKRAFVLPKEKVNDEDVKAVYENGILKLSLAKKEEAKPKAPRLVEIL